MVLLLGAVLWEGKPWQNASKTLAGTEWKIDTVRGVTVVPIGYGVPLPSILFRGNDTFDGMNTCGGAIHGNYRATGDQVTFEVIGSALLICDDDQNFTTAMGTTRSRRRNWDRLYLYDETGAVTFELTRNSSTGYKS